MKNRYLPTALSLYLNYIIHGIGVVIISQHRDQLGLQWGADAAAVMNVVSMLGIGRLIAILISGRLSDMFGRKPFVMLGAATYILYFLGLIYSPNTLVAMILTVLAGIANSFLDSGTYPALMESFPEQAGTANVLIKAAVQIGQFILPFIIIAASAMGFWQLAFWIAAVVLFLNMFLIWKLPFPDADAKEDAEKGEAKEAVVSAVTFKSQPKIWLEGVAFIIYGFISQATFYLISQYISVYGQKAAGMTEAASKLLLSSYSTGSLLCVAFTAIVGLKLRSVNLVLVYTFMSLVSIASMWLFPSPFVVQVGTAAVGFFAAGGVMQLGLTVMGEMFPAGKGTITGIFYTFGSIASYAVPNLIAMTEKTSVHNVMLLDTVFAAIGFVIAIIVYIRYHQTVDTSKK
ncbi:MFS transporter [Streptococcus panodentis]|uniref:MFS transporter n=1 Tax=Streptococcus panodentis TaxID=1581472 RepID=A0ABS5AXY2_9STRE|nr:MULTISPECIES: MFS transporter [Streptococcus]KXT79557.1 putative transport system permease protein [Streptococcus sp. DD11]MBP2621443.1 MFS transporter [Streptococcus panodentis]